MGLAVKAKEMVRFLKAKGFWIARTTRYHIMTNGTITVPVSKHGNEELKPGTLSGILDEVKLTRQELEEWLGRQ